jgi:hypothetical protein
VPGHEGTLGSETADQLARTGSEHPFIGPEPACQEGGQGLHEQKSQKTLGFHNWTQTGEGAYPRALCQKKEGGVEIKQRPIKMGGRTIYWTVTSKGHLFKL